MNSSAASESLDRFPSIEALHQTAQDITGLSNFGDNSYLDALARLVDGYNADPYMTGEGRFRCYQMVLGPLIARLRSEKQWADNPAILKIPLKAPIVVTGLPRTGTTALHRLLCVDPQFQALEFWIGNAPQPRPSRDAWAANPDYVATENYLVDYYQRIPEFRQIHSMTASEPEEDRTLLIQDFKHLLFQDSAIMPEYDVWVERHPMRVAFKRFADNLRLIGSNEPEKRWVLKDPPHIVHMDALLETFPDAKVVQTHRDPLKCMPSICSLIWTFKKYYENPKNDPSLIGPRRAAYWAAGMEKTLRLRKQHPGNFLDVMFHDIVENPIGAVRQVYEFCDLTLKPDVEDAMQAWITENGKDKHGAHHYTADFFGLSDDALTDMFKHYMDEYGIARER